MNVKTHTINNINVAEIISDSLVITNTEDGLDLLGNLYYEDFDKIIIYEKNIAPSFFDLKTGMAGEILQKFSTYRVRLVIVGDFTKHAGQSIKDLIYESNNGRQVNFVASVEEALERLLK